MIRNTLKQRALNQNSQFRFRGSDITRIEAYSDGVFAIATALLIISTSIPQTYHELILFIDDLIPFAICITLLILIWYDHYIFFLRYGFKDPTIVAVNTLFLFLVLFFIYPLKFLFSLLYKMAYAGFTNDRELFQYLFTEVIEISDAPNLMVVYGVGGAAVFFTLAWMYFIAYGRRKTLELNEFETFETKRNIIENLVMGIIPVISIIIAVSIEDSKMAFQYSGMIYMSYSVIMPVLGVMLRKKRDRLLKTYATAETAPEKVV